MMKSLCSNVWWLIYLTSTFAILLSYVVRQYWDDFPDPKVGVLYYYATIDHEKTLVSRGDIESLPSWIERPIFFIIHGYTESSFRPWVQDLTEALIEKEHSAVVFHVDYWNYVHISRPVMTENVEKTARELAIFLVLLEDKTKVRLSNVHIIGFSMGGRVAGVMSSFLPTGRKIGRITGLDPSFPYSWTDDPNKLLDDSDADIVVILRTSYIGMELPLLSYDFVANKGFVQPGCERSVILRPWQHMCNHYRSHKLFIEALKTPEGIVGCLCQHHNDRSCNCSERNNFGLQTNTILRGRFHFTTRESPPFLITKV